MRKYDQLKNKINETAEDVYDKTNALLEMSDEAKRVSNIASNASNIINSIEKDFKLATKLNNLDVKLLMLATALQCARQYIFSNDKFRITSDQGDKLIKDPLKKIIPKDWKDILLGSVPYDAVIRSDEFKSENTGISGNTHRYRTLGHDPILGWIFGPVNILSDSLTKHDFTTYKVKNMNINGKFSDGTIKGTIEAFDEAFVQATANTYNLPAAIVKQAIHFGADYFTKQGLPVPLVSTVNNDLSKILINKYHIDTYSIMRGATLSTLVNAIIEFIHLLFFDESTDISIDLYKIRSKKIIMYSNTIASTSNVIAVAIATVIGTVTQNGQLVKKSKDYLDIGGILVTIHRIISDTKFINEIKREFLEKEFYNIVMG
ncbi:hypothetical protein TPELB_15060 [Terrisporobacter petrolearius]|uniref:Uncharacterized protein n=1 Tax=Terrisporobacter petrolearius TaxID=1460447 RepID=A0ABZ3FBV0_9FIRM